jgi:twitching motility protein PilU
MDQSSQNGMQTYDEALLKLHKEGRIELDEALKNADSSANLAAKINFG